MLTPIKCAAILAACTLHGQTVARAVSFDAASIKLHVESTSGSGRTMKKGAIGGELCWAAGSYS